MDAGNYPSANEKTGVMKHVKDIKCFASIPLNNYRSTALALKASVEKRIVDETEKENALEYINRLICMINSKLIAACVIVEKIDKRLMLSDKILRLSFASNIDLHYMLFALRSNTARVQIESKATGTSDSMRNISQGDLRSIIIPLPPRVEQKRIVAKLEELLPLCEG